MLNSFKKIADVIYGMDLIELFIRHPDGSYEPKQRVTLKGSKGEVTLWPGRKLSPDAILLGISLRELFADRADASQSDEAQSNHAEEQT